MTRPSEWRLMGGLDWYTPHADTGPQLAPMLNGLIRSIERSAQVSGVRGGWELVVRGGIVHVKGQRSSIKGFTHRAMILCDGAVDNHQKQSSKSIAQWEHLSFTIFANFDLKRQLKLLATNF